MVWFGASILILVAMFVILAVFLIADIVRWIVSLVTGA